MIPYDLRKIRAIAFDVDGVLSKETIMLHPNGEPMRTVNIKDGYAIQLAVKRGIHLAIISGGETASVRKRYEKLGVQDIFLSVPIKIKVFHEWLKRHSLSSDEVLYMGDDIPDYQVMKVCPCACCPKDAAVEIQEISCYISHHSGGDGCARDVIEQVLRAQGLWLSDNKSFGW